mmetsp:Transcript_137031/g.263378  ORF Transcript_137031/g.263378 Transcript_137031/m.263378 type:complete len:408 (-) Transcript_137031:175-1398(-)
MPYHLLSEAKSEGATTKGMGARILGLVVVVGLATLMVTLTSMKSEVLTKDSLSKNSHDDLETVSHTQRTSNGLLELGVPSMLQARYTPPFLRKPDPSAGTPTEGSPCIGAGAMLPLNECNSFQSLMMGLGLASKGYFASPCQYEYDPPYSRPGIRTLQSIEGFESISCSPPDEEGKRHILAIILSSAGISGSLSSAIAGLPLLEQLHLGRNRHLTGGFPKEIGMLTKMQSVTGYATCLGEEIPKTFGNLTELIQFRVAGNALSGPLPVEFASLPKLKAISIANTDITSIPEALIWNSSSFCSIEAENAKLEECPTLPPNKEWFNCFFGGNPFNKKPCDSDSISLVKPSGREFGEGSPRFLNPETFDICNNGVIGGQCLFDTSIQGPCIGDTKYGYPLLRPKECGGSN